MEEGGLDEEAVIDRVGIGMVNGSGLTGTKRERERGVKGDGVRGGSRRMETDGHRGRWCVLRCLQEPPCKRICVKIHFL